MRIVEIRMTDEEFLNYAKEMNERLQKEIPELLELLRKNREKPSSDLRFNLDTTEKLRQMSEFETRSAKVVHVVGTIAA